MGLNEAAGYLGVAATAVATSYIAEPAGLRPASFLLGAAFIALGLGLSAMVVRETHDHARHESIHTASGAAGQRSDREVFVLTSFRDRSLSSISQAGLVNNLNDGLAWGLFPVLFAAAGLPLGQIRVLTAVYPAVWGAAQLITGALSDRWGRKGLIVAGMLTQALALTLIAAGSSFWAWLGPMVLLGLGTALVYPTLLAGIGDVAHPSWRTRSVGVYRLWRDSGFAVGALVAGITADALGLDAATTIVAALTAGSGLLVAARMRHDDHLPTPPCIPPGVPDTLRGIASISLHITPSRRIDASRTHL